MTIIYEVTWHYNMKDNPWPTDEFPSSVQVDDMELQKATPRRQVWRYELAEGDAFRLERGLDQAQSCIRYQRMPRGKLR